MPPVCNGSFCPLPPSPSCREAVAEMHLKRFLLRYYPPGLASAGMRKQRVPWRVCTSLRECCACSHILFSSADPGWPSVLAGLMLEYVQSGQEKTKTIDLLDLTPE